MTGLSFPDKAMQRHGMPQKIAKLQLKKDIVIITSLYIVIISQDFVSLVPFRMYILLWVVALTG